MDVLLIALADVEPFFAHEGEGPHCQGTRIELDRAVPDGCFAIETRELGPEPALGQATYAVFYREFAGVTALDRLYLLRKPGEPCQLCRLVRSETPGTENVASRISRRKSFMTPTPLHIPGSVVSPIPDYTHAVYFLEPLREKKMEMVPASQTDRLLPLVHLANAKG